LVNINTNRAPLKLVVIPWNFFQTDVLIKKNFLLLATAPADLKLKLLASFNFFNISRASSACHGVFRASDDSVRVRGAEDDI
jgi:hypothetical protein